MSSESGKPARLMDERGHFIDWPKMRNEAAERLRREIGSVYRIALLDDALTFERNAGADEERERIRAVLEEYEKYRDSGTIMPSQLVARLKDTLDTKAAR